MPTLGPGVSAASVVLVQLTDRSRWNWDFVVAVVVVVVRSANHHYSLRDDLLPGKGGG